MDYNIDFDFSGADTMYLTHSLHPYPAKFPPQLPNVILSKFGKHGQVVLDPFCGSGTTLVEARLLGFNAIGVDVNGLSSLLSKVKATPLSNEEIEFAISITTLVFVIWSDRNLDRKFKKTQGNYKNKKNDDSDR